MLGCLAVFPSTTMENRFSWELETDPSACNTTGTASFGVLAYGLQRLDCELRLRGKRDWYMTAHGEYMFCQRFVDARIFRSETGD